MTPGGSSSGCRMRSIRSSARSSMRCFSPFAASMIDRMRSFRSEVALHQLDDARRQLVGLQDAVDPLLRPLLDALLLAVRRLDDRPHAVVQIGGSPPPAG